MYANMNNIFCLIEEGVIYQVDSYNKVAIGYTNEMYNALSDTTQEYYDKLVELGVIVPEKSQEEINQEIMQQLAESRQANMELMQMIKEMKEVKEEKPNVRTNSRKPKTEVS